MTSITALSNLRAALWPLRSSLEDTRAGSVPSLDEAMVALLVGQGLAPLWSAKVESMQVQVSDRLREVLRDSHRKAVVRYLLQRRTAVAASACLSAAGIRHAVFKGVAVRERLYAVPALRPAVDLDVLVTPEDRDRALCALAAQHYRLVAVPGNLSHEVVLRDGQVSIDLHWAPFRPGRSRCELTPFLLGTARPLGPISVLSDDASIVVMLVHPAFAKHVNGGAARLIRAVDLDRMLRMVQPNWDWILPLIDAAGLRTAAWAVLHWQRLLMDTPLEAAVLRHLKPGRLQRRYLCAWIDRQLPARLGGIPGLVQGAFTLALHDRPGDALRAVMGLVKAQLESGRTLRHLRGLVEPPASGRMGVPEAPLEDRREPEARQDEPQEQVKSRR